MASSGYFQNAFRTGYALRVEWKVNSQSVADNTSNVTVTAYLVSSGSSYIINSSASKTVKLIINGAEYKKTASGLANLTGGQKKSLYSKTVTIPHNADGTKTFTMYCTFDMEVTLSGKYWDLIRAPASGTASATLDTIPRATTPTTSGTWNVGNTVTINTPGAADDFTHTLQYSLNNSTWTNIATGVKTSTTWTLPAALANAKTNATSGTVYIRCITYNGSTNIGSKTISRTYNITSAYAAPSVALSISQTNKANISSYIRERSEITLKATATLKYGATAAKYVFKYGGTTKTVTTTDGTASVKFTLPSNAAASYEYSVTLTDSRGFTASYGNTVDTIAYTKPAISSLEIVRGNYDGTTFTEASKGKSLRIVAAGTVTSLSNANAKKYKIEYRLSNENTYKPLVETTIASSYAVSVTEYTDEIFSENASYVVRFTLSDSFESVTRIFDVPSQRVLLNFSANGKAMAIGGIATAEDALEIMLESYMTGGIKPMQLAAGTDLDEIMKSGFYIANVNDGAIFNTPTELSSGSFLIEVFNAGDAGQRMQRCMYANKTQYRAYVRFYHSSAWGAWQPAEGFTAFSISDHEGRVRFANGFLIQWGRVLITPTAANTITSKVIQFPIAFSASPVVQVSPNAGVPNYLTCSYSSSATELTIHMTRINATATWLSWFAVGISA